MVAKMIVVQSERIENYIDEKHELIICCSKNEDYLLYTLLLFYTHFEVR